jgi:hypothetical protein
LHVQNRAALFELTSGRFDLVEMLACEDLPFWIEVQHSPDLIDREPAICSSQMKVGDVARYIAGLHENSWTAELEPSPRRKAGYRGRASRDPEEVTSAEVIANWPLEQFGVLPGSTLRFVLVEGSSLSV